mmetsp:Transcript_22815/g.57912  ORF Transcript_22815/g.57912 Transcript_22815/m.57912 type:complete len:215 (+) Transcript_22815:742-1386(+)
MHQRAGRRVEDAQLAVARTRDHRRGVSLAHERRALCEEEDIDGEGVPRGEGGRFPAAHVVLDDGGVAEARVHVQRVGCEGAGRRLVLPRVLAQPCGDVPDAHALVVGGRHDAALVRRDGDGVHAILADAHLRQVPEVARPPRRARLRYVRSHPSRGAARGLCSHEVLGRAERGCDFGRARLCACRCACACVLAELAHLGLDVLQLTRLDAVLCE